MSRPGAAALGLLLGGAAWADEPGPVELEAPRVELDDGVAIGDGGVVVRLGDESLSGARFRYEVASRRLLVEEGVWTRPEGELRFTRAEVQLPRGAIVVFEGAYQGADGVQITGEQLRWEGEGRLLGERVRFTTCACEAPPWELEAREVTVVLDDEVRFSGAWLAVCGAAILPIPAGRYPLAERASGLLPPALSWGEDGLLVGLPIYLAPDPAWDLTLQPELRTGRGARALGELRVAWPERGGSRLGAAAGWDWEAGAARGAVDLEHGYATAGLRTAARASAWSDLDYLDDYGATLLGRATPFAESLGVVGWRDLRLESDLFQADEGALQRPASLVYARAGRRLGPVAVGVLARTDVVAAGQAPWRIEDPVGRATVAADARWGEWLGPLRVEAMADARARQWSDGAPWAEGQASAMAALPLWAEHGGGLSRVDLGLAGGVSRAAGEPDLRLPGEASPPEAWVGPVLTARRVASSGVPLSAAVQVPWTEQGFDPAGTLRLQHEAWTARLQGDRALQDLSLRWDDGRRLVGVGGVRTEALTWVDLELATGLPTPIPGWRVSWRGALDALDPALLSHGPGLAWSSPCDCLDASAGATWSQDRRGPDLSFNLQVR